MAVKNDFMHSQQFTPQFIAESIARIQMSSDGKYGEYPIKEEKNSIGSVTALTDKIAITFRGSQGNEIFDCLKSMSGKLSGLNLDGWVHQKTHESFQKIRKQVYCLVKQCLSDNKIEKVSFILEGHCRGSGMAILFTAYMKKKFPNSPIVVLTYSSMAILDQKTAQLFTTLIGEENCLSFIANQDFLPSLSEKWKFCHVGKKIEFSAEISSFYQKNVKGKHYPHLLDNTSVSSLIQGTLKLEGWNAHMLETYEEVVPTLMTSISSN